ncbi:MAG: hypothetical protein JSC189_000735 [Candidatus Tokpelaia sp. JSC189]|nr:MAG: hypothetical protein JSC189_000735 [Candidatus Tokpelaia sp. JSC189]
MTGYQKKFGKKANPNLGVSKKLMPCGRIQDGKISSQTGEAAQELSFKSMDRAIHSLASY